MDGWFNVFPHTLNTTQTHTHNGARITRELFTSSGTDLDGGMKGRTSRVHDDAMRCQ